MKLRMIGRLLSIQATLARYGLDEFLWRARPLRPVAWLRHLRFWRTAEAPLAVRLRLALEELGPIFVKFGQAVSVRRDLLPEDIAVELARLQDQVPPFGSDEVEAMVVRAFGRPVEAVFAEFDLRPLAAASIAQVHSARLPDGSDVVVKLLRPRVRRQIERDLELLYFLARIARSTIEGSDRLHPVEVVAEFERNLLHELDLLREAANASQLRRNFEGSRLLYVPEIYWDYCRSNVLTMERIWGVPISAIDELRAANTDFRQLAENGVEIFFTQVFRHNFFHADMHPGNIFVDVSNPAKPRYMAVDFGIVGSLNPSDQTYLAENFLAFFERDYRRVALLHIDSGWVPPDTRPDELEGAIRAVCEPVFNRPLREISFGLVLVRLFETARAFRMEVQPQLVLLQKTLLAIEGLGRQLYPDLDLWQNAYPILEKWVRQRKDPRYVARQLIAAWPDISEDVLQLPQVLRRTLRERRDADIRPAASSSRRGRAAQRDQRPGRRVADYWPATVLVFAGILWLATSIQPTLPGWAAAIGGFVWLLALAARVGDE
ncbi:MAG: ubiquinone biosynthesis regulatory protein kinase UbiB [Gammaproteobacteria bacterium]|jgi:ubiquinone biosynthesis protein